MIVENETPYTAKTIRLTPRAPVVSSAVLGLGLILIGAAMGAGMFGGAMFLAGWEASALYRTIQPYIDARGTYAILWITIAVPILAIWHTNRNSLV
jgi:hypothetical protein